MDRKYIPITEIIPSDTTNSAITIDSVLNFLCENMESYKLYLLPQGLVCWNYDSSPAGDCYNKVRYEKCKCPGVDRLSSTYHILCEQYYDRLRANEKINIKYLCNVESGAKGIFVDGSYNGGYKLCPTKISRSQLFLNSEDFHAIQEHFFKKSFVVSTNVAEHIYIHPILEKKYVNFETQKTRQIFWTRAEELKQQNPKLTNSDLARLLQKDQKHNKKKLSFGTIRKSLGDNPNLKK